MIEVSLSAADLARIRFAYSPIRELLASVRVLMHRHGHHLYQDWLAGVDGRLRGVRLELLGPLAGGDARPPGFLTPVPASAWPDLGAELAAIAGTPPELVRAELAPVRDLAAVRPLYAEPAAHLPGLAHELRRYWQAALQPRSARLRALAAADVSFRAEQFAAGGIARVLSTLHPSVCFQRDRLIIDDGRPGRRAIDPGGAGLLLVPCLFSWPVPSARSHPSGDTVLTYPTRGVALFREPEATQHPAPLRDLIGPTRATVLCSLTLPVTTTELALRLNLSAAAVSQHLKVLKATGLAAARRRGRRVFYQRTAFANRLLAAHDPAGG